jgi:hypothetical protein
MAKNTKHVGQIINTQKRCVVVFREVPDEPHNCLVVDTDSLADWMHDDIINAVDSPGAQASANFYEYAARQAMSDGTNMLNTLHTRGILQKQKTSNISMTPNAEAKIRLDELNSIIREQSGQEVVTPPTDQITMAGQETAAAPAPAVDTMNEADIAKNMLAQAKTFEAEAKALKEQAYDMAPELKPGRKKTVKQTA